MEQMNIDFPKSQLIGLAGKAGSGKDTVANYLKDNYNFKSLAFADPIRAGMRAMLDLKDDRYFQHPLKESVIPEFGKSPRQMMQALGTEFGRECVHTDLWLILAGEKMNEYTTSGFSVAITDVRFENEAEYIRKSGGVVWHILRDGAGTPHVHASEAGLTEHEGDVSLYNNSTYEDLYSLVDRLMRESL